MALQPVPNQTQIFTGLRTVLLGILPTGVEVVQGQANQVPEPKSPDFVVMTVIRRQRISTNLDLYQDCKFTGSVAGTVLSVQSVNFGKLVAGRTLFGTDAATNPQILTVSVDGSSATLSQSLTLTPRPLAAGAKILQQATDIVVQLDIHSATLSTASDNAQTITTLFRDDSGVQLFKATNVPISPLHADDPRQMPFINGAGQYESRYVVEAHLQVDQAITLPHEFMDRVDADRIPADIFFAA